MYKRALGLQDGGGEPGVVCRHHIGAWRPWQESKSISSQQGRAGLRDVLALFSSAGSGRARPDGQRVGQCSGWNVHAGH